METAATGKMFNLLWEQGRALVLTNGWFEWKSMLTFFERWF